MFINKGESILNNKGIIISICILILILLFNYNKCYTITSIANKHTNENNNENNIKNNNNKINNIENFIVNENNYAIPSDVRIKIENSEILINFNINNIFEKKAPTGFMIILAQYDHNKKNMNNNKFYVSNEYELSSSVSIDLQNYQTNICSLDNGNPICEYKFKNLQIRDDKNKLYYYKIGVSALYKTNQDTLSSDFILPYNVNTDDKLFTIEATTEVQTKKYNNFLEYQQGLNQSSKNTNIYDSVISTPDGRYELIKTQLGNYPDHLIIDNQTISKSSLSDLVDKTMAEGIVNINVKMNEPTNE